MLYSFLKSIRIFFIYFFNIILLYILIFSIKYINLKTFQKNLSIYGEVSINSNMLIIKCNNYQWKDIVQTNIYIISYKKQDNKIIIIAKPESFIFRVCKVYFKDNQSSKNTSQVDKQMLCSYFYVK